MLRAYSELGMSEIAVFDLFFRKLPPQRNYLLACGLNPFLQDLENISFSERDLAYLSSHTLFPQTFIDQLRDFRFTGDVYAVPEGTPVFPNEPILEIAAPIGQAQIIETMVLNQIGLQTILASRRLGSLKQPRGGLSSTSADGARRGWMPPSKAQGLSLSQALLQPRTSQPGSAGGYRWRGPWLTALFRPARPRPKPSEFRQGVPRNHPARRHLRHAGRGTARSSSLRRYSDPTAAFEACGWTRATWRNWPRGRGPSLMPRDSRSPNLCQRRA